VPNRDQIVAAVYRAIDELNKQLPKGVHVEKSLDAPLYGKNGRLESIDVVTLIMEVEDQIRDELGISITIADDRAMSQQNSPFLTIQTLTDYVTELLTENGSHGS
jgi:D-alanine--poly(phosphoribitol) ligase subunit 2